MQQRPHLATTRREYEGLLHEIFLVQDLYAISKNRYDSGQPKNQFWAVRKGREGRRGWGLG